MPSEDAASPLLSWTRRPNSWSQITGSVRYGSSNLRVLDMSNQQSDEEAYHGEIFAALEQCGDNVPTGMRFDEPVTDPLGACKALMQGYGPTPVPRYQIQTLRRRHTRGGPDDADWTEGIECFIIGGA